MKITAFGTSNVLYANGAVLGKGTSARICTILVLCVGDIF